MAPRRPSEPNPPPNLLTSPEEATARIDDLLARASPLLSTHVLNGAQLEGFTRDVSNWRSLVYETLRRLFDQTEYADDFMRAGKIYIASHYDTANVQYNRTHERLRDSVGKLEGIRDLISVIVEAPLRPAPTSRTAATPAPRITVTGNVGTLNLGEIVGNIESHITSTTGPSAEEFREAMRAIVEVSRRALPPEAQEEALQQLEFISAEAEKPPEKRSRAIIGPVLERLAQVMVLADATKTAWNDWGPGITHFVNQLPRG
jgi:hypothetical protein